MSGDLLNSLIRGVENKMPIIEYAAFNETPYNTIMRVLQQMSELIIEYDVAYEEKIWSDDYVASLTSKQLTLFETNLEECESAMIARFSELCAVENKLRQSEKN